MSTKQTFDFNLGDGVKLAMSEERGVVIARSHSTEADPQYRVRYVTADKRMVEDWLSEAALESDAPPATA